MSENIAPKIVIVEDEGLIAADLRGRLTTAGYAVSAIADSAPEALRAIRETSPDLVLMDIRIKGKQDGIATAARVREQFDIPVIFLTAFEDRTTLERASATNAYGYIKKPIASASLRGSIELALAKHRTERAVREQRDWAIASFSAVPYAVVVADKMGRVSYLNAIAERLSGCTAENALRRPSTDVLRLTHGEGGEPIDDLVAGVVASGETISLPADARLLHDDGSVAVEGSVAPRWRDGHVDGAVIAFHDVSFARFRDEQARLESTHQALRRFSDAVLGQLPDFQMAVWDTTLLLDTLGRNHPLRLSAQHLDRTAIDAFEVTARLQSFCRAADLRLNRVSLNELIGGLAPLWSRMSPQIVINMPPYPVPVHADLGELAKALDRILLYSRYRAGHEKPLVIEVSHPDWERMSGWARIRFEYSSPQADGQSLEQAFEPSWAESSAELDSAYTAIRGMGGLVTARLERGDVTVFEVYLRSMEAAVVGQELPDPDRTGIHQIDARSPAPVKEVEA